MAWNGNKAIVELLLENGADVNAKHNKDHTPLHFAVRTGKKEVVKLLLTNGARINTKDEWGYTPLHWAARKGNLEVLEMLLANGADINTKNNDGLSPLEHAAREKHQKIVEVLVENGSPLESEPLPHGRVGEMFDRIEKHDEIDLKLIYQSLIGPQTALRAYAARYLGTHGNGTSIPYLIDALADESMHVGAEYPEAGMATTRYWANDSLKKLTGKDFGFIWNDPKNKRDEAIKRWQQWWQKNIPKPA
jgi:ankyrin repeat protein